MGRGKSSKSLDAFCGPGMGLMHSSSIAKPMPGLAEDDFGFDDFDFDDDEPEPNPMTTEEWMELYGEEEKVDG